MANNAIAIGKSEVDEMWLGGGGGGGGCSGGGGCHWSLVDESIT